MGSAFVSQWCWQSLLGLRLAPLKVKALADSKLAVWQREDWTWLVGWVDFRIFSVKQTLQKVGSPPHSKRFGVGFIQDLGSILAFDNFDGAVEQDSKATAIWGMEIWRRLPNSRGISRICPMAMGVSADRNRALYYCTIFFLKIPVSFSSTVGYCRYFFGCTRCNPRDEKTTLSFPGKEPSICFHLCHTVHGAVETLESQKTWKRKLRKPDSLTQNPICVSTLKQFSDFSLSLNFQVWQQLWRLKQWRRAPGSRA